VQHFLTTIISFEFKLLTPFLAIQALAECSVGILHNKYVTISRERFGKTYFATLKSFFGSVGGFFSAFLTVKNVGN